MIFDFTKKIGEFECEDNNIDHSTIIKEVEQNPRIMCHDLANTDLFFPFHFKINNGYASFDKIATPISNKNAIKNRLLYFPTRHENPDHTPTVDINVEKINSNKSGFENAKEAYLTRALKAQIFNDDIVSSIVKDRKCDSVLLSFNFLQRFILLTNKESKAKNKEKYEEKLCMFIRDFETFKDRRGFQSILERESLVKIATLKGKKLVEFVKNHLSLEETYHSYFNAFNLDAFNQAFSSHFPNKALFKVDSKKYKKVIGFFSIEHQGQVEYLDEMESMGTLLINSLKKTYSSVNNKKKNAVKEHETCSMCLEEEVTVYGNIIQNFKAPYNQFSLYKDTNLPNMDDDHSATLFPICLSCALKLEKGRKMVQKRPFKKFYSNFNMYFIPYTNETSQLKSFYSLFKENDESVLYEQLDYKTLMKKLKQKNQIRFLNTSIPYSHTNMHLNLNAGFDLLATKEMNGSTTILKTIKNISLENVKQLNDILDSTSKMPYFDYIYSKEKGLTKRSVPYFLANPYHYFNMTKFLNSYMFEIDINKSDPTKNKLKTDVGQNVHMKNFLNGVQKHYLFENLNTTSLIKKTNQIMNKIYRNYSSLNQTYEDKNIFDQLMFIHFVYNSLNQLRSGNALKNNPLNHTYSYDNTDVKYKDALGNLIDDLAIEDDLEKALFMLGVMISKIIYIQKENKMTGSFISHLQRPITSKKDILSLYNAVSNMVTNKYREQLGFYDQVLKPISFYINSVTKTKKVDKEMLTFRLIQGYNLTSLIKK